MIDYIVNAVSLHVLSLQHDGLPMDVASTSDTFFAMARNHKRFDEGTICMDVSGFDLAVESSLPKFVTDFRAFFCATGAGVLKTFGTKFVAVCSGALSSARFKTASVSGAVAEEPTTTNLLDIIVLNPKAADILSTTPPALPFCSSEGAAQTWLDALPHNIIVKHLITYIVVV